MVAGKFLLCGIEYQKGLGENCSAMPGQLRKCPKDDAESWS